MAEPPPLKENKNCKGVFAVVGIMSTLVIYGVLQIMRVPYGEKREYFEYLLFLVFCNRLTTSAVCAGALLIWSTIIMQKLYWALNYLLAFIVMLGCALFILYLAAGDISPYSRGRDSTIWDVSLMIGYLGFDGFTSTFQDKLFKGYDMEIHNQLVFISSVLSHLESIRDFDGRPMANFVGYFIYSGLILQGHLLMAVDFVARHNDCFFDIALLSTVATASQFFISYTIRMFCALTFATIMTTRQLVSILLSCIWFAHPLSWEQCIGAVIVFGSLYAKSFLNNKPRKSSYPEHSENGV